jgi:hypothetical protein
MNTSNNNNTGSISNSSASNTSSNNTNSTSDSTNTTTHTSSNTNTSDDSRQVSRGAQGVLASTGDGSLDGVAAEQLEQDVNDVGVTEGAQAGVESAEQRVVETLTYGVSGNSDGDASARETRAIGRVDKRSGADDAAVAESSAESELAQTPVVGDATTHPREDAAGADAAVREEGRAVCVSRELTQNMVSKTGLLTTDNHLRAQPLRRRTDILVLLLNARLLEEVGSPGTARRLRMANTHTHWSCPTPHLCCSSALLLALPHHTAEDAVDQRHTEPRGAKCRRQQVA